MNTLRGALARWRAWWNFQRHRRGLRRMSRENLEHTVYLEQQLQRTLKKSDAGLPEHAALLIAETGRRADLSQSDVLCVGCRNVSELEHFREQGARSVRGVDLYSQSPEIAVMDMHALQFPEASFDIVYSAHSLEHARDPHRVAAEFLRVLRPGGLVVVEVPIRYRTAGADLQDYGSTQGLQDLFKGHVAEVLLAEECEPHSPRNAHGNAVARLIFRSGESLG